jgi:hypothetical protein
VREAANFYRQTVACSLTLVNQNDWGCQGKMKMGSSALLVKLGSAKVFHIINFGAILSFTLTDGK